MAARRNQAPGKPITGLVMLGALAVGGYMVWNGLPGVAAVWAGLVVSAWTHPPAVLTGKKDSRGYPTAAHPGEQAAMNAYRHWEDLKFKLVLPNPDWLPGLKTRLSFLAAVWAGAAAYLVPVTADEKYTGGWGHWIDAAAAFAAVAQYTASRRRTQVTDDENPGARLDSLLALFRKDRARAIGLTVGGLVLGGTVGTVATVMLPIATAAAHTTAIPDPAIWALCLTGGPLALLARPWITEALEHWRVVVAAREEWKPRWEMLKQDPAPRLVDRREVGAAVIDTFDAPGSVGAMAYWMMGDKIAPTLGSGARIAVLDVPDVDSSGQPVPGTKHPLRFEVVRWPADQLPDLTDPATPKEVVLELVRCANAWAADGAYSRPVIDDVTLLTVPAADQDPDGADPDGQAPAAGGAVWQITWYLLDGLNGMHVRKLGLGELSANLQAHVLVDHRAFGGVGCAYAGALLDPGTQWNPAAGVGAADMKRLSEEDLWNARWGQAASKHKENPPVLESSQDKVARLKNGVVVNHRAFLVRQGMTPHDFFAFEDRLPSALNAAPFVAMTGFPGSGRRQGERHPQAFSVYWAAEAVPARPDDLPPVARSEAPAWVIAGLMNQGFKAARLADRPEVVSAVCLTKESSRKHIWKVQLRLYGGVTLAEVRGAAQKLRQAWGSEWLRVQQAADGCVLYVGARPSKVELASPRHAQTLAALDWEQTFLDSGISGIGGQMPVLTAVGCMPRNEQVSILDFDLAGTGLDFTSFTSVRSKLESNSDNAWVEPRRIKDSSTQIQLLACEVNPMPEKAGYDWEHVAESEFIPFATGVEGEPVEYNFRVDPHLLIAGASGGGKSVLLQSLAFGALMRGYELYIADPTKGGADFKFAEPYARAFTATTFEAAAMMKGIYAEVVRRKNLNTAHGVGNYRDLPEDVRPRHMVVLLDEFTSLMGQDQVPPASDDAEMDAEREMILASNRAKLEIGTYTGKIAREARSAGVTLFLATQKLSAKMLDSIPGAADLKVNLSRLLMGKATYGDKQSALRAPQDAPDLGVEIPPGRGLFETTAGAAMAIQAWYDPAEQQALAQHLDGAVDPLEDDERLDLSRYMMKLPEPFGAQTEAEPEAAADTVVDLGEIELGLDELDWSDADLDGPQPEDNGDDRDGAERDDAEQDEREHGHDLEHEDEHEDGREHREHPEREQGERDELDELPEVDEGAAVLFDVDGAIAPFVYAEGMEHLAAPGHGTVMYRPDVVGRQAALPVVQAWLTSWEDDAPAALGHLFPRAHDVLAGASEEHGWWKIDAALAWLAAHQQVRKVVWIDDELAQADFVLGVPFSEVAAEAFELAGVEALLVVPDPDRGTTHADVDRVEAFLGLATPATPAATTAAAADTVEEPAPDSATVAETDLFADADPFGADEDDEDEDPFAAVPQPPAVHAPVYEDDPFA